MTLVERSAAPAPGLRAAWAFARPHTVVGTALSVVGLYVLAAVHTGGRNPATLAATLVAALAVNVYIVGLNQLTDIDIDRINKPHLPLASGAFLLATGHLIVWSSLAVALAVAAVEGPLLLAAIVAGAVVGSAYSLPPLRLKRSHVWAAAAIVAVRGPVVNLLVFAHLAARTGGTAEVPVHVLALTGMVLGLSLVIAWFKDIPDAEGDRSHAIRTLTLRLGPRRTITLGLALLWTCYAALAVGGLAGLPGVHGPTLAIGHLALLGVSLWAALRVDVTVKASVTRFYLVIWGLFFAEYLLFPAAGLLA